MNEQYKMTNRQVKITVVKKIFNKDLADKYTYDPSAWHECDHFNVGDVFITDMDRPWDMPEGFCGWAWADIQKLVYGIARDGQPCFVTCCTDGYRPVFFQLEKIV
jgi:uncharacterized repeat protein (TIGR04076 family)